jgi:hypothetical protein
LGPTNHSRSHKSVFFHIRFFVIFHSCCYIC